MMKIWSKLRKFLSNLNNRSKPEILKELVGQAEVPNQ